MDDFERSDDEILDDEEDESQDASDAADADGDSEESDQVKRYRDLQSKADKAEARANKLEKELAKTKASTAKVDSNGTKQEIPAEVREWLDAAESRTREALYEADPRFKKFDIDPSLITGDSPEQLAESQKALSSFVDKLEGSIRNDVLVEHGFSPEPAAADRPKSVNYATMTSEEFAKIEKAALDGGMLRRS